MNYITPLKISALGELSQLQPGDWLALKFGGVGQKFRGSVPMQSGTSVIPFDNTTPLATEGTQLWTQTVTPQGIDSVFHLAFDTMVDINATNKNVTITMFRGTTFLGCRVTSASAYNGLSPAPISISLYDTPGVLTPVTYSCRIGIDSGTWYLGQGNAQTMGGTNPSYWSINEEL